MITEDNMFDGVPSQPHPITPEAATAVPQLAPVPAVMPPQTVPKNMVEPPPSTFAVVMREILETILLTAIIFFAVNAVTGRFKIEGSSMYRTFEHGEYILVNRLSYAIGDMKRGDVIVFVPPGHPEGTFFDRLIGRGGETDYIKRIVGMPGDVVEISNSAVTINGMLVQEPYINELINPLQQGRWELTDDQFFVMGDNRNFSADSRSPSVGPISQDRVVGKVLLTYFPISSWSMIDHYRYPEFAVE